MEHWPKQTGAPIAIPADARARLAGLDLRRAGCWLLGLTLMAASYVAIVQPDTLASYYFFRQDLALLAGGEGALFLLARLPGRGGRVSLSGGRIAILIAVAALVAYLGSFLVIERYGMSRDEDLADFAARYFAQARMGMPVPAAVRPVAEAMLPLWADARLAGGYWVSNYLPVHSLLRAAAGLLGDRWLTEPLLLAIGLAALWSAARRLWPDRSEAASVATLLAIGSAQLVANAMTPYATTAHFAFNALWLACFARADRRGHALAMLVGLVAAGLHQLHFHLLFVAGFILQLWRAGERRTALAYAFACAGYVLAWDYGYARWLLDTALGAPDAGKFVATGGGRFAAYFARVSELQPVPGLARFVAWQNVLLAPLALIGARGARAGEGPPALAGMAMACLIGCMATLDPVHGLGYRYLNGLIPCFCLLGAAGWLGLRDGVAPPSGKVLWGSVVVAWLFTLPFALWRTHELVHPYAAAYRAARSAPADVVLVDSAGAAFLQDIVRFDDPLARPLLLDLSKLAPATIADLCRRGRVMTMDGAQARALGVPGAYPLPVDRVLRERRDQLAALGCHRPVLPG